MLWSQDQNLTVDISIPLTPYQRKNGSYKSVQKVLSKLRFVLRLYEEGVFLLEVSDIHKVLEGQEGVEPFWVIGRVDKIEGQVG